MSESAGPVLVNKRQLAQLLNKSVPHVDELIRRYPDLPIINAGWNGTPWQFDAAAVTEFLRQKADEEERAARAHEAQVAQYALPVDDAEPEETRGLDPKKKIDAFKALKLSRELQRESGFLVPTADVRAALIPAIAELNRFLQNLPDQIGRKFNLPDGVTQSMRALITDQQASFVRQIGAFAPDSDADQQ